MKSAADSTDAELDAFERLCDRLGGFDPAIGPEWLDGAITALIAGPRAMSLADWLPLLCGDAWERAIADPEDLAAARDALQRRWNTIAEQLRPERLFDEAGQLHLQPLIELYDTAERDALLAEGKLTPEEAAEWPLTGEGWAVGFLEVVDRCGDDWQLPDGDSDAALELDACLRCIELLTEHDDDALKAELALRHRGRRLSRDELIDEACFAVQDLRCLWLEQRTRTAPRRVAPTPGRNDPCHCGSGRKYKKCHGAA